MSEGQIFSGGIVDTLLDAHRRQCTGVVRLQSDKVRKQLALRGGLLAYAESSDPDDHLVRVLIKMKLIPRSSIQAVAQLMKGGLTADQAVVQAARIGMAELEQGLREQA